MRKFILVVLTVLFFYSCSGLPYNSSLHTNTMIWSQSEVREYQNLDEAAHLYIMRNLQVEEVDGQPVNPKTAGLLHLSPGLKKISFKYFDTGRLTSNINVEIPLEAGESYYLVYIDKGSTINFDLKHIAFNEDGSFEELQW